MERQFTTQRDKPLRKPQQPKGSWLVERAVRDPDAVVAHVHRDLILRGFQGDSHLRSPRVAGHIGQRFLSGSEERQTSVFIEEGEIGLLLDLSLKSGDLAKGLESCMSAPIMAGACLDSLSHWDPRRA